MRITLPVLAGLLAIAATAAPSAHGQTPRADRVAACLTVGSQPAKTTTHVPFTDWTADSVRVDGKALTLGDQMAPGGFVMYGYGVVVRVSQRGHVVTVRASSVVDRTSRVCVRGHKTTPLDRIQSGE